MPDLTAFSKLFQPLGLKEGDWCLHMENQPWNPHPHVAWVQFAETARARIPDLSCLSGCPGAGSSPVEAEAMCLHSLRSSMDEDMVRLRTELKQAEILAITLRNQLGQLLYDPSVGPRYPPVTPP